MTDTCARIDADLREASIRLERAETRGDGASIARYTAEVDSLMARRDLVGDPEG